MAVTSLQEALPIPDLPASLDGLPEALFSSSWCAYYVPSASYGMISWTASIDDYCLALWSRPRTPRRCGKLLGPAACFSANHHSLFTCSG